MSQEDQLSLRFKHRNVLPILLRLSHLFIL